MSSPKHYPLDPMHDCFQILCKMIQSAHAESPEYACCYNQLHQRNIQYNWLVVIMGHHFLVTKGVQSQSCFSLAHHPEHQRRSLLWWYGPMMVANLTHTKMPSNAITQSFWLIWQHPRHFLSFHLSSFIIYLKHINTLLLSFLSYWPNWVWYID